MKCAATESTFIARVLTAGMGRLQYGIEDAREAMASMVDAVRAGKDSWISYLGIIGTLGPLLGLVGTVSGMIGAFRKLGESDKAPEASELAGEISHALVVTLVGVAIAVPGHFLLHVLQESPDQHLREHGEPGRRPVDADVPQLEKARRRRSDHGEPATDGRAGRRVSRKAIPARNAAIAGADWEGFAWQQPLTVKALM